jgi:hypothetical protein
VSINGHIIQPVLHGYELFTSHTVYVYKIAYCSVLEIDISREDAEANHAILLAVHEGALHKEINSRIWHVGRRRTPPLWTMHFGGPLVPEEYRMYNG